PYRARRHRCPRIPCPWRRRRWRRRRLPPRWVHGQVLESGSWHHAVSPGGDLRRASLPGTVPKPRPRRPVWARSLSHRYDVTVVLSEHRLRRVYQELQSDPAGPWRIPRIANAVDIVLRVEGVPVTLRPNRVSARHEIA